MMELLTYMINKDVADYRHKNLIITHHEEKQVTEIKVAKNEIVYIHKINIEAKTQFELSYYSAIESRKIQNIGNTESESISRHIGTINFQSDIELNFTVHYVKLKFIK